MNDGNTSWKTACETLYGLCGEYNFWYEHNAAFAGRDDCLHGLEIDLCFSAASDAVQKNGPDILSLCYLGWPHSL